MGILTQKKQIRKQHRLDYTKRGYWFRAENSTSAIEKQRQAKLLERINRTISNDKIILKHFPTQETQLQEKLTHKTKTKTKNHPLPPSPTQTTLRARITKNSRTSTSIQHLSEARTFSPEFRVPFEPPVNILDLIFVSNFFIVLSILSLWVFRPFGFMGPTISSASLYVPQGLYTNIIIDSTALSAPTEQKTIIDIDHSQFETLAVDNYTIKPGDTLSQIAIEYGLNMDTLISFNQIPDVRRIQIGQEFKIPNRDGLMHAVQQGDSLQTLSEKYVSSLNAILDANSLTDETILPGQTLFIPGARMSTTELKLALGELFIYPVTGYFTSGFGYRADPFTGKRRFHNGIDLANITGTSVRASMAGRVVHTESQIGNYGKFVIIQHTGGFQTLYAHLDNILVKRGTYVTQGERIGRLGNTGRSTGPHLHFSIIRNGEFIDPLAHLH